MAIKAEEELQSSAVATQAEYTSDREYNGKSTSSNSFLEAAQLIKLK